MMAISSGCGLCPWSCSGKVGAYAAVSDYGASYKFTATYFGSALGYLIDAINDVPVAVTQLPPSVCYWEFYVKYPNGTEVSSPVGVSSFTFNSSGYGMTMRYHDSAHSMARKLKALS